MYNAMLDDGRVVVVDTTRSQTRKVKGEDFFIDQNLHVNALLDGKWQVVRVSRLKKLEYGNPFKQMHDLQGMVFPRTKYLYVKGETNGKA